METTLMVAVIAASNILCFVIGAKVGQQTAKGEPVKISVPDPIKVYRTHKAEKEELRQKTKMEAILANVDRYDGFSGGQEDIPK